MLETSIKPIFYCNNGSGLVYLFRFQQMFFMTTQTTKYLLLLFLSIFLCFELNGQEICDNALDDNGDGKFDLNDEECNCDESGVLEWDPTLNGLPLPIGTYPYVIEYKDIYKGDNLDYGSVHLIK